MDKETATLIKCLYVIATPKERLVMGLLDEELKQENLETGMEFTESANAGDNGRPFNGAF